VTRPPEGDPGLEGDRRPRLVAALVYDTRSKPLPAGVRAVVQRARRLLYTAERFEIVVQISPAIGPDHVRLVGQVLRSGLPVADATIRIDGLVDPARGSIYGPARTATDDDGSFRLADLPIGRYSVEIGTPEQVVAVPPFDLEVAR
jgi:hypothetical protein